MELNCAIQVNIDTDPPDNEQRSIPIGTSRTVIHLSMSANQNVNINPFTALARKTSELKDARVHLQTVQFPVL